MEANGAPVRGAAQQRKTLALLALLAASRRGISRDKLIAFLWPESDAEHARNALKQACHALRRDLHPDLFLGAAELRLNPDVITSDIASLQDALDRGDQARAVAAYAGPFLDGFYLHEAGEFERWVEATRAALKTRVAEAFESLATQAASAGDAQTAAKWWRRLAALDPLSSRAALGLMRALDQAGERAEAVAQGRRYEAFVRQDLGVEPASEVVALAQELHHSAEREARSPQPRSARPLATAGLEVAASPSPAAIDVPGVAAAPPLSKAARLSRRLGVFGAAGVLVAGGALLLPRRSPEAPSPAAPVYERTAIAVLPFRNQGAEGPHAYLAGGLHDELLTQLSKVAGLRVISRTSVIGYAGTNTPLKQIASELGVGSVVEASVQVVGQRLRVNVQLIDAATDAHLWVERYDRTLEDVFAVQSEIAQQIVAAVGATLSSEERRRLAVAPTANPEAYQFYLQGRQYWTRPGGFKRSHVAAAEQLFRRAVALDAGFAVAHAAISEVHGLMYWFRWDPTPARARQQWEAAEAAVRLAPGLPQAHAAMGLAHYWGRRDYRRALDEFAIALRGLPNDPELWTKVGWVQRRLGNWDEALAALEKARQLDPLNADRHTGLGAGIYSPIRRYAEAVRSLDRALSLAPDAHEAAVMRAWTYVTWRGRLDTLRAVLSGLPEDADLSGQGSTAGQAGQLLLWERQADSLLRMLRTGGHRVLEGPGGLLPAALFVAWAHQLRGDQAAARSALDSALLVSDSVLREVPDDWRAHAARGLVLAELGRRDEALREARWLEQSVVYREDAFDGPNVAEDRAGILVHAGETKAALDEIERLLARPAQLSVHTLRLDPRWDPIRKHPRFKALVTKPSPR